MHLVPIFDSNGNVIDKLAIDDVICNIDGRVSRGKNKFYKGIGNWYDHQYLGNDNKIDDRYIIKSHSDVFYLGLKVVNINFVGKFGIFEEKYQPQFDDHIFSCGTRELSIIENSSFCKRSDVVVEKVNKRNNNQYWFELQYKSKRIKYLTNPKPKKLYDMLIYMCQEHWNFVWDKNSIMDVSYDGNISDVADIFYSNQINHKIGTIYSILYSLHYNNIQYYFDFIRKNKLLNHVDQRDFINNCLEIIRRSGVDISEIEHCDYQTIIIDYLLTGKNCGDCVLPDVGNRIRSQYIDNTKIQFGW